MALEIYETTSDRDLRAVRQSVLDLDQLYLPHEYIGERRKAEHPSIRTCSCAEKQAKQQLLLVLTAYLGDDASVLVLVGR